MTWLEDGLVALKKRQERKLYSSDPLCWLGDADEAILNDVKAPRSLVSDLKLSSLMRSRMLTIYINANTYAQYAACEDAVEFEPVANGLSQKKPGCLLESEESFQKHLQDLLWQACLHWARTCGYEP